MPLMKDLNVAFCEFGKRNNVFQLSTKKKSLGGESFPEIILQMSFIRLKSGVFNEVHSVR